jgi:protein SCO1/2
MGLWSRHHSIAAARNAIEDHRRRSAIMRSMTAAPPRVQSNAFLALLAFAVLGAGMLFAVWRGEHKPGIPGLLWPDPPTLQAFSLTRADGAAFTEANLRGRWTFMFFGFTQCPDVCPSTLSVLKQVKAGLADDASFRELGQVLFVSVDPARDTPERIGPYVRYFDENFEAATGPEDALTTLTRQIGVIFARIPGSGDDYTMDHTASIFLVDPQLRVLSVFGLPHDATEISARYRAVVAFAESHP